MEMTRHREMQLKLNARNNNCCRHDQVLDGLSVDMERRTASVAQDIVFSATGHRIVKHTMLAMALHHMSRRTIDILNRLGHRMSYCQDLEAETAMAEHIAREQSHPSAPPPSINKEQPFFFVWDNNDLKEETLSGMETTHCTHGIIM
eukprot:scpid96105/ scgid27808/ 